MTAADQLDTLVAKPEVDTFPKGLFSPKKMTTTTTTTTIISMQSHLHRRSSFQKIMNICNQGYSAFPHFLIRLQDVQTTVSIDFARLIHLFRSTFLTIAVFLSVFTLFSQFLFLIAMALSNGIGLFFYTLLILALGLIAFKCFSVAAVAKRVHRSLSCRKKVD